MASRAAVIAASVASCTLFSLSMYLRDKEFLHFLFVEAARESNDAHHIAAVHSLDN